MFAKNVMKFFSFFFILTFHGFSQHKDIPDYITDVIFQHASNSIHKIEGEKIFLKQEKICIWEGKIFVEGDEGEFIYIHSIYADDFGIFLMGNPRMQKNQMLRIYICTNYKCGQRHYDNKPYMCERCHNVDFYVRYVNAEDSEAWD